MKDFFTFHHLLVALIWFLCGWFCARMHYKQPDYCPEYPQPNPIHWSPGNKVVLDHRDGTIDLEATNLERAKRGLPVPWRKEFAEAETRMPDIL